MSFIASSSGERNTGPGGDITLDVGVLSVTGGSVISTQTLGRGSKSRAGHLTVRASKGVIVTGTGASTSGLPAFSALSTGVLREDGGDGGRLRIRTLRLEVTDGGIIDASTSGAGRGGDIDLQVRHLAVGAGGQIRTSTIGAGVAAGNLSVHATEEIQVSGRFRPAVECPPPCGRLFGLPSSLGTSSRSAGPAGRAVIRAPRIEVSDGGVIASSGLGRGRVGDVLLIAGTLVVNDAQIQTAGRTAEGGRIGVEATDLVSLAAAAVTSDGARPGVGDSVITLRAPAIVLNSSEVTSLTGREPIVGSGEARLLGQLTVISPDSRVAASSTLEVTGLENDLTAGIDVLPGVFLDASNLLRESCAARRGGDWRQLRASEPEPCCRAGCASPGQLRHGARASAQPDQRRAAPSRVRGIGRLSGMIGRHGWPL